MVHAKCFFFFVLEYSKRKYSVRVIEHMTSRKLHLSDDDETDASLGEENGGCNTEDAYLIQYAQLLQPAQSAYDDESGSPSVPVDGDTLLQNPLTRCWVAGDAVRSHVRDVLASLPADYADDNYPCAVQVQEHVLSQHALKSTVDTAFHHEMHSYTRRALPVVPEMLDLCDACDETFGECCETAEFLERRRITVSQRVRVVALQRRRQNLRRVKNAIEEVLAWSQKIETVVTKLQERDFCTAIVMLGARMYSESGSPLLSRDRWPAPSPALPQSLETPSTATSAAPSAASSPNGAVAAHTTDSVTASSDSAVPKRAGRQRSTTIAYMAHSHGPVRHPAHSPERPQSPTQKASASLLRERRLEEFIDGVGGVCSATVIGRGVLSAYFELKENATELVVHSMRAEVYYLFTTRFVPARFVGLIDGLHALRVRGDSIPRFFLNCIEPMINDAMHSGLVGVVGDDAGPTWEEVAITLLPSEFHDCTVQVLAKLCTLVRTVLKVQQYCDALVSSCSTSETVDESVPPSLDNCLSACRFLSSIGGQTVQKCLAAAMSYSTQVKLGRGQMDDALHVYHLLHRFVDVCESASPDGAALSMRASLNFQCQRFMKGEYMEKMLESITKVMQDDTFMPFPASVEDFQEIFPYIPNPDCDLSVFYEYLKLQPLADPVSLAELVASRDSLTMALGSGDVPQVAGVDGAINPFFTQSVDPSVTPAIPACKTPLQLFDSHVLFTFGSFMTCKKMLELAATVVQHAAATADLMNSANSLACVYVWFVLTHFVAANETVPLDIDSNATPAVRDFAKLIKSYTLQVSTGAGYPLFAGCNCNSWKTRSGLPQFMFSAQERITAICSVDSVVACHRLVVCALTPLLPPEVLSPLAAISEALGSVSKYASAHGIRRVALNVFPSEPVAASIERFTFPSAQPTELSPPLKQASDAVYQLHQRLKELHRDLPFVAAQRLIDHMVFNLCVGVVEGVSRQKKLSDGGKQFLLQDVTNLCRLLQKLHPSIPLKLFEYVTSFTKAFTGPFVEAVSFVQQYHVLYTGKQLNGIGEKEGFLKKRELDALMVRLQHEDKVPLHLIES